MTKIKLSNYVERLTADESSESFSFDLYSSLITIVGDDDSNEEIKVRTRNLNKSENIDMIL